MHLVIPILLAIAHVAVSFAAASFIGRPFVKKATSIGDETLNTSLRIAIGMGILSYILFALVCMHKVSPFTLRVLFALTSVMAMLEILRSFFPWVVKCLHCKHSKFAGLGLALFSTYAIFMLAQAVMPPSDRDELIYHLAVPKQILKASGFDLFRDNVYAYFPQLGEMFFLWAIATFGSIGGEIASKLYHMSFGFLLALTLYKYSRFFLSQRLSAFAAAILLTTPSVMTTMPLAYVDLTYAFYAFMSFLCLLTFLKKPDFATALMAGALCGLTASTKYTGISYTALLLCVILISKMAWKIPVRAIHLCVFLSISALVSSPYFVRNFALTGWPLFPFAFLYSALRDGINWDSERATLYVQLLSSYGAPIGRGTLLNDILSPIFVFAKGKFDEPLFYDGSLGLIYLFSFFSVRRKLKNSNVTFLWVFTALFFFYWTFTTKQARFLFPILPILSFLTVWGISTYKWRGILITVLSVFLSINLFSGARESLKKFSLSYLTGGESRTAYLQRLWPGFAAYFATNDMLGPKDTVYLVNMKNYVYYLDCAWRTDFVFERFTLENILQRSNSSEQILASLKREGITHILLDRSFLESYQTGLERADLEKFSRFISSYAQEQYRRGPFAVAKLV